MTPEISILIPVYNVENYIAECLESLIANTIIDKCEIVLCNDCTPDNSMEIIDGILKQHQDINVRIIAHTENMKIAVTRQDLLEAATGKYILFVDSDDWVEPDYLEKLYTLAEETQSDITTCNVIKEYANNSISGKLLLSSDRDTNISNLISTKTPGYLTCRLLRRSVITENNLSFDPDLFICEDTLFMLKFYFCSNKTANTNIPLYHYRIIQKHQSMPEKKAEERIKSIHKIEAVLEENGVSELFKSEVAFRKINQLMKFFHLMPLKQCRNYYGTFSDMSDNIKMNGLKGRYYKLFARSLEKNNRFLCDCCVLTAKLQNRLKRQKHKKTEI